MKTMLRPGIQKWTANDTKTRDQRTMCRAFDMAHGRMKATSPSYSKRPLPPECDTLIESASYVVQQVQLAHMHMAGAIAVYNKC